MHQPGRDPMRLQGSVAQTPTPCRCRALKGSSASSKVEKMLLFLALLSQATGSVVTAAEGGML